MSNTATGIPTVAAPTAALYTLNAQLIEKSLADLKDEHVYARPNEHTNSIHWIFGHITATRFEVARFLGATEEHSFGKLFSMSAEHKSPDDYPAMSEVMDSFKSITGKIDERFAALNSEEYYAAAEIAFPGQDKTVCGCVTFLNFHETYHVGQLALLRKFFGYDRLVG